MKAELRSAIAKAQESLEVARENHAGRHFDFAAGRAYYAAFYVAEAALATLSLNYSSHAAVTSAFAVKFIKTGKFKRETHSILIRLFRLRMTGDYGDYHSLSEHQSETALADAELFLATVIPYLEEFMSRQPDAGTDSRPDRSE